MGTLSVIETEGVTNPDPGISSILICFQIHLLILHCPPQPLDEYPHVTPGIQEAVAARFDEAFSVRYNKSESEAVENHG